MTEPRSGTEAVRRFIKSLPATMSKGQKALESLTAYRAARLPVPDDVLRQIDKCYQHFIDGKPTTCHPDSERVKPAPLTLGEAFEVPDLKGGEKSALKRKRLALANAELVALFTGQGVAKLSRTGEGYDQAAKKLGLTAKEVEGWVTQYLAKRRSPKPAK